MAAGLDIRCPVLVLHAERSFVPRAWTEDIRTADVVLDVADMQRLAPRLGRDVRVRSVPDGVHDLALSPPAGRAAMFAHLQEWLASTRRTRGAQ